MLRKSGVVLKTSYTEGTGEQTKIRAKASIQGAVALVLKGKVEAGIDKSNDRKIEDKYDEIEFNLELPDDVADLMHQAGDKKVVILENFHYLPEELQRTFAYDLRTFQDLKVRFVILRSEEHTSELQSRENL